MPKSKLQISHCHHLVVLHYKKNYFNKIYRMFFSNTHSNTKHHDSKLTFMIRHLNAGETARDRIKGPFNRAQSAQCYIIRCI
jgi:hypothetical protein